MSAPLLNVEVGGDGIAGTTGPLRVLAPPLRVLAPMVAANAVSTAVIVEYSAGPASSAAATSNSVSSDEGAAPTNDVIPANTCDDRFATWLLSADERDAVADDSAETLVAIAADNDSTPAPRCATADARTDPCVETAVCTEVMDWVVPEMMDVMDAARAAVLDPRFV